MDSKYTGHLGISFRAGWREWERDGRQSAVQEVLGLFEQARDVMLRGAYVTQGFRSDTDLLLWMHADTFESIQDLELGIRKSAMGAVIDTPWAFAGVAMEAEFNKAHLPAFIKGIPAKQYLCFYPYIRTPEWYIMKPEERAALLKEHGMIGREYPDILTNGVNAFGLGDYEWLLSFESDDLERLVAMVRQQREARARLYTKHEWPFIVGRRFELEKALDLFV